MNSQKTAGALILLIEDNIAHATLSKRCLAANDFVKKN